MAASPFATALQATHFAHYPPQARELAVQHLSVLRTLPIIFAAVLLRELIGFDWQFPAERAELVAQLELLKNLNTSGALHNTIQSFAALPLSAELQAKPWAVQPEAFMEALTAYLWTVHATDAFRAAATQYSEQLAKIRAQAAPATPRLCIVLMGRDGTTGQLRLFEKLRRYGCYFNNVDTTAGLHTALEVVTARAQADPASYAHWYIDGATTDGISGATGLTTISYAALTPMRRMLLQMMHDARTSGTVGPEDLRSLMLQLRPEQFAATQTTQDEVMRHFQLDLLTQGSGTQIFSTTFVQWAAREVLRRARPSTLVLRYAPRQAARPMNDLVFASATPEQLDPHGSMIDADMGAYYTWLNLTRLSGAEKSRFIACHEGGSEAIAIAPALSASTLSTQTCTLRQILEWTA
jgi:hypothetical protein